MKDKTMNPFKMKTANIVAFIFVVFCFGFVYLLVFIEVPEMNKDLINFLAGILFGTGLGGVIYWLYNYRKDGPNSQNIKSSTIPINFNCPVCGKPFNSYTKNQTEFKSKNNPTTQDDKPSPTVNVIDPEDEEQINPDTRLDIQ